jgi:predicted GNAT family acetyltransferase
MLHGFGDARPKLWLPFFPKPSYRGAGAGKLLMKKLATIALENNCGHFEWSVLHWNKPAIDFYQHVGAEEQGEWRIYQSNW